MATQNYVNLWVSAHFFCAAAVHIAVKEAKKGSALALPFKISFVYASMPREERYFLTISATLKVIASSN